MNLWTPQPTVRCSTQFKAKWDQMDTTHCLSGIQQGGFVISDWFPIALWQQYHVSIHLHLNVLWSPIWSKNNNMTWIFNLKWVKNLWLKWLNMSSPVSHLLFKPQEWKTKLPLVRYHLQWDFVRLCKCFLKWLPTSYLFNSRLNYIENMHLTIRLLSIFTHQLVYSRQLACRINFQQKSFLLVIYLYLTWDPKTFPIIFAAQINIILEKFDNCFRTYA